MAMAKRESLKRTRTSIAFGFCILGMFLPVLWWNVPAKLIVFVEFAIVMLLIALLLYTDGPRGLWKTNPLRGIILTFAISALMILHFYLVGTLMNGLY
jgi:hypothetical protein